MAWFSKKGKDDGDGDVVDEDLSGEADGAAVEGHTGRPVSRALLPQERGRVDEALQRLTALGVDVDDLDAIGAAYDAASAAWRENPEASDSGEIVELFGMGIGEHLARHSAREWAVVTDVFGTDLGLVAARAETVIVPHNLVGARWMRSERGWIPGVVSHLVAMRPRQR